MGIPTLRTCHFEASEDIMTKFKSQGHHIKCSEPSPGAAKPVNCAYWIFTFQIVLLKKLAPF